MKLLNIDGTLINPMDVKRIETKITLFGTYAGIPYNESISTNIVLSGKEMGLVKIYHPKIKHLYNTNKTNVERESLGKEILAEHYINIQRPYISNNMTNYGLNSEIPILWNVELEELFKSYATPVIEDFVNKWSEAVNG